MENSCAALDAGQHFWISSIWASKRSIWGGSPNTEVVQWLVLYIFLIGHFYQGDWDNGAKIDSLTEPRSLAQPGTATGLKIKPFQFCAFLGYDPLRRVVPGLMFCIFVIQGFAWFNLQLGRISPFINTCQICPDFWTWLFLGITLKLNISRRNFV